MNEIEDIRSIVSDFGGHVKFETPIVCKISPHSKPEKIYEIYSDTDISGFSQFMIYTILQRLRLLYYYKNKTHEQIN